MKKLRLVLLAFLVIAGLGSLFMSSIQSTTGSEPGQSCESGNYTKSGNGFAYCLTGTVLDSVTSMALPDVIVETLTEPKQTAKSDIEGKYELLIPVSGTEEQIKTGQAQISTIVSLSRTGYETMEKDYTLIASHLNQQFQLTPVSNQIIRTVFGGVSQYTGIASNPPLIGATVMAEITYSDGQKATFQALTNNSGSYTIPFPVKTSAEAVDVKVIAQKNRFYSVETTNLQQTGNIQPSFLLNPAVISFSGKISDAEGQLIKTASLKINGGQSLAVKTGYYSVDVSVPATSPQINVVLSASASGYKTVTNTANNVGANQIYDITLVAQPPVEENPTYHLYGQVIDSKTSAGIANATIMTGATSTAKFYSDQTGLYSIQIPTHTNPQTVVISIEAAGYQTKNATVTLTGDLQSNLIIDPVSNPENPETPTYRLYGKVMDETTSAGIAKAVITTTATTTKEFYSDQNGLYEVMIPANSPSMTFQVTAKAEGYSPATVSVTINQATQVNMILKPIPTQPTSYRLYGQVMDSKTLKPVANAAITTGATSTAKFYSDQNGLYEVQIPAHTNPQTVVVTIEAAGYQTKTAAVTLTGDLQSNLIIDPIETYRLYGKVLEDVTFKPIANAQITAGNSTKIVKSGSDGLYEMIIPKNISPMTLQISIQAENYRNKTVTVTLSATDYQMNLILEKAQDQAIQYYIHGKIKDNATMTALNNATVKAVVGDYLTIVKTDAEGNYQLYVPVAYQGLNVTVTFTISSPGYHTYTAMRDFSSDNYRNFYLVKQ